MATMLRLYEATDALAQVSEWLDEHSDEMIAAGGEIPTALAELIDQAEGDFATKVERVGLFAKERLAQAKMVKAEADSLAARAKRLESQGEAMKRYLLLNLQRANRKKVEGKLLDVRVQANAVGFKHELTPEQLKALHADGSPFVVERVVTEYVLPADGLKAAYQDAIAEVGKPPEIGEDDYEAKREAWQLAVAAFLVEQRVPAGVRVERGFHVRFG